MVTLQGIVQNGTITIEGGELPPDGTRVQITVIGDKTQEVRGISGKELLESGIVGIWADRDDIGDTATFAEELRRRSEKRG
jgi:hypothetical protein